MENLGTPKETNYEPQTGVRDQVLLPSSNLLSSLESVGLDSRGCRIHNNFFFFSYLYIFYRTHTEVKSIPYCVSSFGEFFGNKREIGEIFSSFDIPLGDRGAEPYLPLSFPLWPLMIKGKAFRLRYNVHASHGGDPCARRRALPAHNGGNCVNWIPQRVGRTTIGWQKRQTERNTSRAFIFHRLLPDFWSYLHSITATSLPNAVKELFNYEKSTIVNLSIDAATTASPY